MEENFENVRAMLASQIAKSFPGLQYRFIPDPEDESVIYPTLYGVKDGKVDEARAELWSLIDGLGDFKTMEFIPAIKSLSVTRKYYAAMLPVPVPEASVTPTCRILPLIENTDVQPYKFLTGSFVEISNRAIRQELPKFAFADTAAHLSLSDLPCYTPEDDNGPEAKLAA